MDTTVSSCRVHVFIAECDPLLRLAGVHGICLVEFALAGSEGLKGKNFSSSPLLTVIVPASGRQERIYLLTKELEEKVARLHLLALGAELTASAMKREDTMQAVDGSVVDGSVVLVLEICYQR